MKFDRSVYVVASCLTCRVRLVLALSAPPRRPRYLCLPVVLSSHPTITCSLNTDSNLSPVTCRHAIASVDGKAIEGAIAPKRGVNDADNSRKRAQATTKRARQTAVAKVSTPTTGRWGAGSGTAGHYECWSRHQKQARSTKTASG